MKPNKKTYSYIFSITFIAILFLLYLFFEFELPSIESILFWSLLAIIAESFPIILPNHNMAVSVGSAINLSSIIVGGPLLGAIVYPLGLLLRFPYIAPRKKYCHILNTPYYRTMFNVSQGIIVTSVMGLSYIFAGGKVGGFYPFQTILMLFLGTMLNTIIISGLMTFLQGDNFIKIWLNSIKGTILNSLTVGVIGLIIALSFIAYGYWVVILFFGPLILARHSFKLYVEMRSFHIATIQTLTKALEAKDPYTSGHSGRVEEYAVKLAREYGLRENKIKNIRIAAALHDIGKIGIKDSILNKAEKLTEDEFAQIMSHPKIGSEIISKIDIYKDISPIIRHHHERYDGLGYPEGLKGDEIPIEACILTIADSFDAMTSDRSYRDGLRREVALKEIEDNAGSQFHPLLAREFIKIMSEEGVGE